MADTGILAMLAKPSKKGAPGKPAAPESKGGSPVADSLRDMFDALKEGRDDDAETAFRAAYEHCSGSSEPDADEMGGESDYDMDD
jgi:hypothetical protein